jgi:hypothetical protein
VRIGRNTFASTLHATCKRYPKNIVDHSSLEFHTKERARSVLSCAAPFQRAQKAQSKQLHKQVWLEASVDQCLTASCRNVTDMQHPLTFNSKVHNTAARSHWPYIGHCLVTLLKCRTRLIQRGRQWPKWPPKTMSSR